MPAFAANNYPFTIEYPEEWSVEPRAVPNLRYPVELCSVSNRPIRRRTTANDPVSRPLIDGLDASAIFVWSYIQPTSESGDPLGTNERPNYPTYSPPLRFHDAEVWPSSDAREWNPNEFQWMRLGFAVQEGSVSVWVWQGTQAGQSEVMELEAMVESIRWRART